MGSKWRLGGVKVPSILGGAFLLLFVVSLGINVLLLTKNSRPESQAQADSYPLLARRIFVDHPNDILINFVPLRKELEKKFHDLGVEYSFYFEYLPDGTSIRIGDDKELVGASLIKLPLVMNLYRAAELGRIDLDKTVKITESEVDGGYGGLYKKGAGVTLTLREAARLALKDSDNTAAHAIFDHVNGLLNYDEESLARLDIDQNLQEGQAVISAKSYASVLKGLYFASFLNKVNSQELLGYLAQSTSTDRLPKDLPRTIPVAHKIGVFNTSWSESDCGIVYVPQRPYLICVMVGLPDEQASQFIADISKLAYDFVSPKQAKD